LGLKKDMGQPLNPKPLKYKRKPIMALSLPIATQPQRRTIHTNITNKRAHYDKTFTRYSMALESAIAWRLQEFLASEPKYTHTVETSKLKATRKPLVTQDRVITISESINKNPKSTTKEGVLNFFKDLHLLRHAKTTTLQVFAGPQRGRYVGLGVLTVGLCMLLLLAIAKALHSIFTT
jgi:hypothetical protein